MALRIIFAGTPEFSVATLQSLIDSEYEVVAVYTQPDRGVGRGRKLQQSPVKQLALMHHIEVVQPTSLRSQEEQERLKKFNADLMVVVAYGMLLPQAVLDIPRLDCINVHASLLPRWRGAAPIQQAILSGDAMTGVTIMKMVKALDAGDMLLRDETPIRSNDTSQTVHDRLAEMGACALMTVVKQYESDSLVAIKQDEAQVTYASKIKKEDARINWQRSAIEIDRLIRAYYGWPVAYCLLGDGVLRIWQAEPVDVSHLKPGETDVSQKGQLLIGCGDGALSIKTLQLPGAKAVPVTDFLNSKKNLLDNGVS